MLVKLCFNAPHAGYYFKLTELRNLNHRGLSDYTGQQIFIFIEKLQIETTEISILSSLCLTINWFLEYYLLSQTRQIGLPVNKTIYDFFGLERLSSFSDVLLKCLNIVNTKGRTPLDEGSALRNGLCRHKTTQHVNTKKNMHASSGIQTHDPSKQVAKTHALTTRQPGSADLNYLHK